MKKLGLFDIGVDLAAGVTTVLPYPIWMTTVDTAHTVRFASPTDREVVITNPAIPGLEVHLPAGAVVRDVNGKPVTGLGISAIPVDRPPFPLPNSHVPVYFIVQPGRRMCSRPAPGYVLRSVTSSTSSPMSVGCLSTSSASPAGSSVRPGAR